jgi:4-aminobutyrate aminotransferase/(S)-3-amino-2-methylpropionate transaminase
MSQDKTIPQSPSPSIPGEPERAKVLTAVPGPQTEVLRARHGKYQDSRTVHVYQDAKKSLGNYMVDVDGNTLLDLYGHIAALPVGYNHPDLLAAWKNGRFDWAAGYRPALGIAPSPEWVDIVENTLSKLAPKGLSRLVTVTTGSEAVENALKAAFIRLAGRKRRGAPFTAEELQSSMLNQEPGSPKFVAVSFEGGFHGRSLGALSATRSKPIHKLDIPAFDWPVVPFPASKFPLSQFAAENKSAETHSLEIIEKLFKDRKGQVAALIVEPIQGEGGDRHASAAFFRELRKLTAAHEVAFIVDEVQTGGGACGTFWAHEAWQLETPPDLVTFSKKMQIGGYFLREEFFPAESYRIFNTFLGDPLRAAQLEVVTEIITRDHLLANVKVTGEYLMSGLTSLSQTFADKLSGARAQGTFAAIDVKDSGMRDRLLHSLRQKGLEMGGSGDRSVRFRPALVFSPRHAAEALSIWEDALRSLV